jgi:cytochrome b involved in lipid metabolism
MKSKALIAGAILLVVLAAAFFLYETHGSQGGASGGITSPSTVATSSTDTFTAAQVATHNSAQSCWTIIDGNVYDLTQWIPAHPGGEAAILSICGIDGSSAFHGEHDHAQEQEDILTTFQIGVLKQ